MSLSGWTFYWHLVSLAALLFCFLTLRQLLGLQTRAVELKPVLRAFSMPPNVCVWSPYTHTSPRYILCNGLHFLHIGFHIVENNKGDNISHHNGGHLLHLGAETSQGAV